MDTPITEYIRSYKRDIPRDGITRDVAFNRLSFDDGEIHNPDQGHIHVGLDNIVVELIQDYDDETLRKVLSYAINATQGIDPDDPPIPTDWEEMFRGGLQTALEDFRIAFAVHGASRTATHQIVRSRRAAFHQQSQRAHYYGDRPSVRMPESWVGKALETEFEDLAEHAARIYRIATESGVSYQDARFALLEGTTNFILCEYSLAEFIALYAYRACSMFQWEIQYIVRRMGAILVEAHPYLGPYVKISCEKTHGSLDGREADRSEIGLPDGPHSHTCTFQGWEEVEGQCDFPWARESNRQFKSDKHSIGRGK